MPFTNAFNILNKALKSATKRPLQRFNIYNRSKKYIGEESQNFFPAPRAIGPLTKIGPSQYPHLEAGRGGGFKSVKQRRVEAIAARNDRLLQITEEQRSLDRDNEGVRSYSEIRHDDRLVIEGSNKLPVIKTVERIKPKLSPSAAAALIEQGPSDSTTTTSVAKSSRPLPKLTNLDLRDPASIWHVDKVPPGRLDLNKLQELLLNKMGNADHWTPKLISEAYNIKEEYAENLITYLKQIRVVVSPRVAKVLDYVNRANDEYNQTKHIVYVIDKSLRDELDRSMDDTFLPEDELDESIRELLDASQLEDERRRLEEKPIEQLRIGALNVGQISGPAKVKQLTEPLRKDRSESKKEESKE